MVNIAPIAIFLGATAVAVLAFYSGWEALHAAMAKRFERFESLLDRAGAAHSTEDSIMTWLIATTACWILLMLLVHPAIWLGLLLLPICATICAFLYGLWVQLKLKKRIDQFVEQLELALRLMASGLRTGLGLRQSLAMVTEEMPDPARYEYSRLIGQANIGVSLYDAFDDLAERLPQHETQMMARVIRVQSNTGGDMAKVLEQLANTIKERRRMRRKISALTAEGRAGALVLESLPIVVGSYIAFTQEQMGHALLYTQLGHIVIVIVLILEILGILTLNQILKVNV